MQACDYNQPAQRFIAGSATVWNFAIFRPTVWPGPARSRRDDRRIRRRRVVLAMISRDVQRANVLYSCPLRASFATTL